MGCVNSKTLSGGGHATLQRKVITIYPSYTNKGKNSGGGGGGSNGTENREVGLVVSSFLGYRKTIPKVSVWTFFNRYIQATIAVNGPENEWIIDHSKVDSRLVLTYGDIEPQSRRLANSLFRLGLLPKQTLIYCTSNVSFIYCVFFAAWRLNVAVRSSSPEDSSELLLRRIEESNCRFILCDPGTEKLVFRAISKIEDPITLISFGKLSKEPAIGKVSIREIDTLLQEEATDFPEGADVTSDMDNDIVLILNNKSKGASHTHKSFITTFMQGGLFRRSTGRYSLMLTKSSHHSGIIWPLSALTFGKTTILLERITLDAGEKAIKDYHISDIFGYYPTIIVQIALKMVEKGDSCYSVESIVTGSSFPTSSINKVKNAFPNLNRVDCVYGKAEFLLAISTIPPLALEDEPKLNLDLLKKENIGRLLPFSMAKVVDTESETILGINQPGELCFKNQSMMNEYGPYPDGWIHTGEIGYYDEDGLFYITGRINEIFKYYGDQISPAELESVIMEHEDVVNCAVVPLPDNIAGAVPCAVVCRKIGSNVSAKEIREFVDSGGVVFIKKIPLTPTGKVARKEVLKFILNGRK